MKRKTYWLLVLLALTLSACSAAPTAEPTNPPQMGNLPQTEADVPRVSVEEAKAAFDSGEAVIMDVRVTESFIAKHITGAFSMPLQRIEANPASVRLDKSQWIITYCT